MPAPTVPRFDTVCGCAAFVDIVGYTALTERHALRGPDGAEELGDLLQTFFTWLEREVAESGGDIYAFAGDSVLALWTEDSGAEGWASAAASRFADRVLAGPSHPVPLRIRVALGKGAFRIVTVGGHGGHWHHVLVGEPLLRLADALQESRMSTPFVPGSDRPAAVDPPRVVDPPGPAPRDLEAILGCYLPSHVRDHLAETGAPSEYRTATTLFVRWNVDCPDFERLEALQDVVLRLQRAVERFDGCLTRISVDDKGFNALSVWGLPGRSHPDDADRAVRAALTIHRDLESLGTSCSIGVSTGRVLCGLKGASYRFEYGLAGSSVNLAARLMASSDGGVICDAPTVHQVGRTVGFEPLGRSVLKGRSLPSDAFRATELLAARVPELRDGGRRPPLVGRAEDRRRLLDRLDALDVDSGGVVVLVGEPGIGKTSLLHDLAAKAIARGAVCLVGRADAVEARTMYFAWRAAIDQYLRLIASDELTSRRDAIKKELADHPHLIPWLGVLDDILPFGFGETPVTMRMGEQARAEATSEIVVCLLEALARRRKIVLVMDDGHWLDSMSWRLIDQVRRRVGGVLIAVSLRMSESQGVEDEYAAETLSAAARLEIEPLGRDETAALLCVRLGVSAVVPEVLSLVHHLASGNPLFVEEIALALRASGRLRIAGDLCALDGSGSEATIAGLGGTVQAVIASRVDLLSPARKLALQTASVLGSEFSVAALAAVLRTDEARAASHIAACARLDLLVAVGGSGRAAFKHGITREVTYAMITHADRRKLHALVAQWYEREGADELGSMYPLLAHHWELAGRYHEALHSLHMAGEHAVARFANREAVEFLQRCLSILRRDRFAASLEVHASCERLLGYAMLGLGRMQESRAHLQASLALLGFHVREGPGGQLAGALGQLARAVASRIGFWKSPHELSASDRHAAVMLMRLGHIAYFQEDPLLMLITGAHCVALAARGAVCREVALMLAALASAAGSIPMHRVALGYGHRALRMADSVGEPVVSAQALLFSAVYRAGVGDWQLGLDHVRKAGAYAELCGDNRRREETLVVEGYLHFHRGDTVAARECFEDATRRARQRGDPQTRAWGLLGSARVWLRDGEVEAALQALEEANEASPDRVSMIEIHGQTATARLLQGETRAARDATRRGLALAGRSRPTSFSTMTGIVGIAETLIGLHPSSASDVLAADGAALDRETSVALGTLSRFARIFPIGRPALELSRAHRQHSLGRRFRALRHWRRAFNSAEELSMPYEMESAARNIAQHAPATEAADIGVRLQASLERMANRHRVVP